MSTKFTAMAFPSVADPERMALMEEARVQGHAAGYAAGMAAARLDALEAARIGTESLAAQQRAAAAELDYRVTVLSAAATAMHERAVPVLETIERALASAALELAETVIGREMAHGDTSVRAALGRALNPETPSPVHTVRLHPDDCAVVPAGTAAGVKFTSDASLRRGDAVAEYTEGFLDARISTALARIRRTLLGEGE